MAESYDDPPICPSCAGTNVTPLNAYQNLRALDDGLGPEHVTYAFQCACGCTFLMTEEMAEQPTGNSADPLPAFRGQE